MIANSEQDVLLIGSVDFWVDTIVKFDLLLNGIASIIAGLSGEKNHKEKNGRNNTLGKA
jgi:uncharacterized protein YhjY with autotransporter beta-barrel domain